MVWPAIDSSAAPMYGSTLKNGTTTLSFATCGRLLLFDCLLLPQQAIDGACCGMAVIERAESRRECRLRLLIRLGRPGRCPAPPR